MCAGAMPGDPREMAFLGPPAIAVHDYRDVAREAGEIEFREELRFFRGDGAKRFGMGTGVRHGYGVKPLYGAKLTQELVGTQRGAGQRLSGGR